jgi:hypothetical protein
VIDKKIDILRELFPSFRIRKGYEFVTFCPSESCRKHNFSKVDPKKKLEINLNFDKFACWRCHYKGHAIKLIAKHGTAEQRRRYAPLCGLKLNVTEEVEEEKRIELPPEYKFVFDYNSDHAELTKAWLANLGVPENVVVQNRIGFCDTGEYRDRIIFPSFDSECSLNYFVTRHMWEENSFKWLKCRASMKRNVFNEIFVDWTKPLILVETVKTYLKHFEEIDNMIVCNGSFLSKEYDLFNKIVVEDCPKVYVAFDPDAKTEALETLKNLDSFGVECCLVDLPRQSDEMDSSELEERINDCKTFDKIDVLRNKINNLV